MEVDRPLVLPIALKPSNLRPIAYRVLTKKYGLNIKSTALERLSDYIGRNFGNEWRGPTTVSFLEQVGRMWKDQNRGLFINGDGVDELIKEITVKNRKKNKSANVSRTKTKMTEETSKARGFEVYDDLKAAQGIEEIGGSQATQATQATQETGGTQETQETQETLNTQILNGSQMDIDEDEAIDWKDFFKVIDPSRYTKFKYDARRKQFELSRHDGDAKRIILPTAEDTVNFHINKFHLLKEKLLRNEHFQPSTFSSMNSITGSIHPGLETQQITPIKNLLGRHGQNFALFGLLTINAMGLWQLQDDTDAIVLELSQCIFPTNCYIIPGNYLICDGIYSNSGKFYVSSIAPPPPEDRDISLNALGNLDFSGIYAQNGGRIDGAIKRRLPLLERKFPDHKILFLGGDIFLNDLEILEALKRLFKALTEEIEESGSEPLAIVMPGSFVEKPLDVTEFSSYSHITSSGLYKSYFDSLASILEKFPKICSTTKFVLLPGDKDPWSSMVTKNANAIWPKFRIPSVFGTRLRRGVKNIDWASNPCKMNYLSHDVTIVRDDIGERFRRNDITYVSKQMEEQEVNNKQNNATEKLEKETQTETDNDDDDEEIILEIDKMTKPKLTPEQIESRKVVKTLLDQGDLSPFSVQTRPVLSNYWPLLSLIPLPDLLILVDPSTPHFDLIYENCHVLNPGKFYKDGKISYMEYTPSTRKARLRQLS
ncbi:hypothetical protein FOA43_002699 [Brettanomyces nanus]|uniref:DNA polymerase epsilon subunit B n=1 Tax=Eeniella nana TaxID=13502 RepID=A0A875S1V5_EENNA|nr:uncharacterized protein FOA43_002699 [Brettanomyces nanus]QPG75346.1 hypothetical protein FOA43_002699 [Brettanomyces nanus]